MKQLIIFDCDGVLVDSEIIAHRIDAEGLSQAGYCISAEESIQRFTGMNKTTAKNLIFKERGIHISEQVFTKAHQVILKAFEKELKGLMHSVLNLVDHHSIQRCVASSSPRDRVIHSLKLTNQFHFFEENYIFTSQQVKHGKPAPDLFLLAASKMGFKPEDCLVIEDSFAGIEAAQAARMAVIGFSGGSHTRFPWYQEKLKTYNIPLASNEESLMSLIQTIQ